MGLASINAELKKKFSKKNPDLVFDPSKQVEYVSSGNIIYDIVNHGGFPKKRITEIISHEHLGKTSLLMQTCALLQKQGLNSVFFDYEAAFDPNYALATYGLKVDMDTFTLYQPDTWDEGLDLFDELMSNIEEYKIPIALVCFDSIAMMKPKALIELTAEDSAMVAIHARCVARMLDKVKVACRQHDFAAVFTNQFRATIKANSYQPTQSYYAGGVNEIYTTPGGQAPRYYSSVRVKLDYGGRDDDKTASDKLTGEVGKAKTGKVVKIVNIKNRLGRPELMGLTHFVYPDPDLNIKGGWDKGLDIVEILKKRGRMYQKGTKLTYNGLNIPEWTSIGSAQGNLEKFFNDRKAMKDAEELLLKLTSGGGQGAADMAKLGVDYDDSDVQGQDEPMPEEDTDEPKSRKKKGKIELEMEEGESSQPIRNITL